MPHVMYNGTGMTQLLLQRLHAVDAYFAS